MQSYQDKTEVLAFFLLCYAVIWERRGIYSRCALT